MFDIVLVAAGRTPNTKGLELDKIGMQVEKNEIVVNDQLQTHVKHILL